MNDYFVWLQRYLDQELISEQQYNELAEILSSHAIRWTHYDAPMEFTPEYVKLSYVLQQDERQLYDELMSLWNPDTESPPRPSFAHGLVDTIHHQDVNQLRTQPKYNASLQQDYMSYVLSIPRQGSRFFPFRQPQDMLQFRENLLYSQYAYSDEHVINLYSHHYLYGYTEYGSGEITESSDSDQE